MIEGVPGIVPGYSEIDAVDESALSHQVESTRLLAALDAPKLNHCFAVISASTLRRMSGSFSTLIGLSKCRTSASSSTKSASRVVR